MVGEMHENGLDGELDDELGYIKYDYHNKEGENSRSGYSKKTIKTSFGETKIKAPRGRKGVFELQLVKKNQAFSKFLKSNGQGINILRPF